MIPMVMAAMGLNPNVGVKPDHNKVQDAGFDFLASGYKIKWKIISPIDPYNSPYGGLDRVTNFWKLIQIVGSTPTLLTFPKPFAHNDLGSAGQARPT